MKNVIISIVILMLVGCGEAEATSESNITNRVIKPKEATTEKEALHVGYTMARAIPEPVEIYLDDLAFEEAFALEHRAKGEGHTFWWRGEQYTTNLAVLDEFVLSHIKLDVDQVGWVTNNDDPDDNCRSNKLDDCGVCDGWGKTTWFRDKDKDGLGTFAEWITSCTYPTTQEIERFHEEGLQEYGGDQGVIGE